jgi:hypothetical protein
MKETEKNQLPVVQLPPAWCGSICRNAMNEACVEHCAIKRDCSAFEPKKDLKLIDMPRFPNTEKMTKEEKFASVTIYLAKVVDHLQGEKDEPSYPALRRPNHDNSAGSGLPANLEIQDLLSGVQEKNSPHPLGTERESSEIRPSEVVGSED